MPDVGKCCSILKYGPYFVTVVTDPCLYTLIMYAILTSLLFLVHNFIIFKNTYSTYICHTCISDECMSNLSVYLPLEMSSKKQKVSEHVQTMAAQVVLDLEVLAACCTIFGDTTNLELLLKSGLSVNTRCKNLQGGPTLLHLAAAAGHAQVVLFLLRLRADRSVEFGVGGTPLHQAALNSHVSTVKA